MSMASDNGSSVSRNTTFWLNFDFELGWGVIANGRWRQRESVGVYQRLRDIFPSIVSLLDDRDLAADWATVGAMSVSRSEIQLDHLPSAYADAVNSFLVEAEPPTYDGRDLVGLVSASKVQRVVSHGYSHITLDRSDLTSDAILEEVGLARTLVDGMGGDGSALVFPENRPCPTHLLAELKVSAVRTAPRYSNSGPVRALQKVALAPAAGWSDSVPAELCGSMLFKQRDLSLASKALFAIQRSRLLTSLRGNRSQCIWLHPFNFCEYPNLLDEFTRLVDEVALLRDKGVLTIGSLSDRG